MIDLAKVFPIQSIEKELLIAGNGDATFGYKVTLPEINSLDSEKTFQLHEMLVSVIEDLPVGTIVQQLNYFYETVYKAEVPSTVSYTAHQNLLNFDGKGLLKHYSELYFTLPSQRLGLGLGKTSENSFTKVADYIFKKPFKDYDKQVDRILDLRDKLTNTLNSLPNLACEKMDNEALGCSLYNFFNLSYDKPIQSGYRTKTFDPMSVHDEYLKVGNTYLGIVTLLNEESHLPVTKKAFNVIIPGKTTVNFETKTCMVHPVSLGLPINHITNLTLEILDPDTTRTALSTETRNLNFIATFSPDAKEKQNHLTSYVNDISEHNLKPIKMSFNVLVTANSKETVSRNCSYVKDAIRNMNKGKSWIENAMITNQFFVSCPGNARANKRTLISYIDHGVTYMNLETHYKSDSNGILFADCYGNPFYLNNWNNKYTVNRNKQIYGPSGAGKSHWLNNYIDNCYSNGHQIIIIDRGGSYERNCIINDGLYFDTGNKNLLKFNLFLCKQDEYGNYLYNEADEDGEGADDQIVFIRTIVQFIWKGGEKSTTREELVILSRMIDGFYKYINKNKLFPLFDLFVEFCKTYYHSDLNAGEKVFFNIDSFLLNMSPYANVREADGSIRNGLYSELLNSTSNVELKKHRYIVFDVEKISKNEELSGIVNLIIMNLTTFIIERLPRKVRKTILLDEAIDGLKGENADFFGALFRKIRKSNGEIDIATQGIDFLNHIDPLTRDSIFINCDTKIILSHSNVSAQIKESLKNQLSFTDHEMMLIENLVKNDDEGYREFFIKQLNHSRVLRSFVAPITNAVYTTTGTERDPLDELFKTIRKSSPKEIPDSRVWKTTVELYIAQQQQQNTLNLTKK